jgi:ABC-type phosphate/phosphonate transport system permease subunit
VLSPQLFLALVGGFFGYGFGPDLLGLGKTKGAAASAGGTVLALCLWRMAKLLIPLATTAAVTLAGSGIDGKQALAATTATLTHPALATTVDRMLNLVRSFPEHASA